jgi:maltose-binding protein MalE
MAASLQQGDIMQNRASNFIPGPLLSVPLLSVLMLLCLALSACSPPDSTPKIAEDQREVLKSAEEATASIEQSAAQMQQDIDAQSN